MAKSNRNDFFNDPYGKAEKITINGKNDRISDRSDRISDRGDRASDRGDRISDRPAVRQKRSAPVLGIAIAAIVALAVIVLALYIFVFSGNTHTTAMASPSVKASVELTPTPTLTPTPKPKPTPTPTPKPTPTPTPAPKTMWGANFPDKFTTGNVEKTDNSYKSAHVNVNIKKAEEDGLTYYVADIYLTDLKYFRSAFASGKYSPQGGASAHAFVDEIGKANNAVVAVDGTYYTKNPGVVYENGEMYRDKKFKDIMVLFNDGTMKTYKTGEYDLDEIQQKGVWQIWNFGPELLDENGQAKTNFNLPVSNIGVKNPRTAVGYYEPGHYCFVTVDGRQSDYSKGLDMKGLSKLMNELGCKAAFNFDGGGSTAMAFNNKIVNQPCANYREICDILYITDNPSEDAAKSN